MDSMQLPLRNCGRCRYWGATRIQPPGTYSRMESPPVYSNGAAEHICGLGKRGHDRDLNPDYMFASDRCSKWERA